MPTCRFYPELYWTLCRYLWMDTNHQTICCLPLQDTMASKQTHAFKNAAFILFLALLVGSLEVNQANCCFVSALSTTSLVLFKSATSSTTTRSTSGSLICRNMAQATENTGDIARGSKGKGSNNKILSRLSYRSPTPRDISRCFAIESASYPADEAASLEGLQYRQQHAGDYFQLCVMIGENNSDSSTTDSTAVETIVGFICSTRCNEFTEESMSTHDPTGKLLAIHSVVVEEPYRKQGIAKAMLQHYVANMKEKQKQLQLSSDHPISSMVLLAKAHLLGFYVQCGFQVNRPSPIVHGQELWYELQQDCGGNIRAFPNPDESWFCKTEHFKRPFPQVKPFLEEHKMWVEQLRQDGYCITSGYRVDAEGQPGGGGLMFLAAKSYQVALKIVQQDPLVANDCVDWELNGWIGQVGDIQMR